MTFEEQMELAMKQSLMETSGCYDHNPQFDDVISNGDHGYSKTDDRFEDYEEMNGNYDVGPDHYDFNSKTVKSSRKRSISEGEVGDSKFSKLSVDTIFTSKETPPYFSPTPDIEKDSSESISDISITEQKPSDLSDDNKKAQNSLSPRKIGSPQKGRFFDRISKASREICNSAALFSTDEDSQSDAMDLTCDESLDDVDDGDKKPYLVKSDQKGELDSGIKSEFCDQETGKCVDGVGSGDSMGQCTCCSDGEGLTESCETCVDKRNRLKKSLLRYYGNGDVDMLCDSDSKSETRGEIKTGSKCGARGLDMSTATKILGESGSNSKIVTTPQRTGLKVKNGPSLNTHSGFKDMRASDNTGLSEEEKSFLEEDGGYIDMM